MVLLTGLYRFPDLAWSIVETIAVAVAAARGWSAAHAVPGGAQRQPRPLSSGASLPASPFRFTAPRSMVSSCSARSSAPRPRPTRIGALELAGLRPRRSFAARPLSLERAVGSDRIPPYPARSHSQEIWRSGRAWGRFRFLGFLNCRRIIRDSPRGRDGRRAWQRAPAVPL